MSKIYHNVISTGSHGNAVIYHDEILVDIGVAYKHIEPFLDTIQYILISHEHKDHLNMPTLIRAITNYPEIRVLSNKSVIDIVNKETFANTIVLDNEQWYQLDDYKLQAFPLVHDVENIGFKIIKDDYKIFHATDTNDLEGVSAYDYDLYCLEHNHLLDSIKQGIEHKEMNGGYIHEYRSMESHLSYCQAEQWLVLNNIKGEVVRLHASKDYGILEDLVYPNRKGE